MSHPGVKATTKLITSRYVWPNVRKDCARWVKTCMACQKSKIQRHTKSTVGHFPIASDRFRHVHLDLIGPLPPSRGFRYCLTCIDRFTRWPEVYPISEILAETVASTFYAGWVARFGVPETIVTDQGRQFESDLFSHFSKLIGAEKSRTTSYHPNSNGLVERFHRQLKAAIKCHEQENWVDILPSILLGIRCSLKEDLDASPAELVYGTTLSLPGDFIRDSYLRPVVSTSSFLEKLRQHMQKLRPTPVAHHSSRTIFIHKDLATATHVLVRHDAVRRPLQQPYDGPYRVISRHPKFYMLQIKGKKSSVSIDRLKPAFFLKDPDEPVLRPSSQPTPRATASSPDNLPTTTRYGRKVRFRIPPESLRHLH